MTDRVRPAVAGHRGSGVMVNRVLPRGAVPLVEVGQTVEPDDTLATLNLGAGALRRFDCAGRLGIDPQELARHVLVEPGDRVEPGQALAVRTMFETPLVIPSPGAGRVTLISHRLGFLYLRELTPDHQGPVRVNLSAELGLSPKEAQRWLRCRVGDSVRRGQPLAGTSSPYFGSRYAVAPVDGTLTAIDVAEALVEITPAPSRLYIPALVGGTVSEVAPGRQVRIEVAGWRVSGRFGVGGPAAGRLIIIEEGSPTGDLTAGAVGLVRHPPSAEELKALEAAGVRAVVGPAMHQDDLVAYLGREVRVGITGGAGGARMTILLLDGFAPGDGDPMPTPAAQEALDELATAAGSMVYVDGRTQVRAGARRPEVVVLSGPLHSPSASPQRRLPVTPPQAVPVVPVAPGRPMRPTLAGWLAPGRPQRPPEGWLYPCCRPASDAAYALRFPNRPSPSPEPPPGDSLRRRFTDLPVLEGETAERLGGLAARLARPVVDRLPEALMPCADAAEAQLTAFWVVAGALVPALRRVERQTGRWGRRSRVQRVCPGFVLSSDAPATVLRAVPTGGGTCFLVPVGRAYGIAPWHLDLLGRGDVAQVLASVDGDGRVDNLSHGFTILSTLGLVAPASDHRTGRVVAPTAMTVEAVSGRAPSCALNLAGALASHWEAWDRLVADLPESSAGTGDLTEAFYACVVDAVLSEAMRVRLIPEPPPMPVFDEFLKGARHKKVWLTADHVPLGSALQTSNSWPMDEMTKPLSCGPDGG